MVPSAHAPAFRHAVAALYQEPVKRVCCFNFPSSRATSKGLVLCGTHWLTCWTDGHMARRTMRHVACAASEYKCLLLGCVDACTESHSAGLFKETSAGDLTAFIYKQAVHMLLQHNIQSTGRVSWLHSLTKQAVHTCMYMLLQHTRQFTERRSWLLHALSLYTQNVLKLL